jgi:acetyltransferase-like isoleucine patch superfamily enzyme
LTGGPWISGEKDLDGFAEFGGYVTAGDLAAIGLELDFSVKGLVRIGNRYEAPCSLKTTIREISAFGAFSYVTGRCRLSNVSFGRYCSIAEGVSIGYPEHPTGWLGTSVLQYMRPPWVSHLPQWDLIRHDPYAQTNIGHDVWIGAHAFIRAGVTIGTGSIVGARSVVTKDVQPYTIVAGNPARAIRARLPSKASYVLEDLRWWEFSPAQLSGCPFDKIDHAIKFLKEMRNKNIQGFIPDALVITEEGARIFTGT